MKFFHRRRDDHMAEEIETHLSLLEEQYRRGGMSTADARDAARRRFGSVLKTRQMYRDQQTARWIDVGLEDARVALRQMAHNRAFTLAALLVLGLGIGVNNMMFTLIYGHTLRGLPIDHAERVLIASFLDERGATRALAAIDYEDVRREANLFSDVAAFGPSIPIALGDPQRAPDRHLATYVTANAFATLRIQPHLGRTFTPEEDRPGGPPVVMLGGGAWRARYAADATIVGRDVLINGQPRTVVGVMPERSGFPTMAEVWMPASHAAGFSAHDREARALTAIARIRDGISRDRARAQIEALLNAAVSRTVPAPRLRATVTPISERYFGSPTHPAWLAFIASGFLVLLVSCANVANLLLARGVRRRREIAIRGALGASRGRVLAQLLVESAVMATLGGAIGVPLSLAGVRVFGSFVPADALPYWIHYDMDGTVAIALVAVSFGAILVFGLLPALHASKTDVVRMLRDGGWSGSERVRSWRWTTAFMTIQIALAVVLLRYGVTSWLDATPPTRSDAIITTPAILTASLALSGDRYQTVQQRADFFLQAQQRLEALPGAVRVSLTSHLPNTGAIEQRLQVGPEGSPFEQLPRVSTLSIAPSYFDTLRVPVLRGREFVESDRTRSDPVAIVNQRFVTLYFPADDAIGRRLQLLRSHAAGGIDAGVTIVGVAEDVRQQSSASPGPIVYLPLASSAPTTVFLLIRSEVSAATMSAQLRDAMLTIDPNLPVFRMMTMERVVSDADWNRRVSSLLVTALQIIVLMLSAVGLYAVTAQAVYQRSKELGIRTAVGARPFTLCRLVLGRASLQVALGLGFGVLGMMTWDRAFFADGVDAPFARAEVFGAIAAILTIVTIAACLLPMRRATRIDPVITLRED